MDLSVYETEIKGHWTHVLMTCIREDDDGKATQDRDCARWLDHSDIASLLFGVSFDEMGDDQYDQIRN